MSLELIQAAKRLSETMFGNMFAACTVQFPFVFQFFEIAWATDCATKSRKQVLRGRMMKLKRLWDHPLRLRDHPGLLQGWESV